MSDVQLCVRDAGIVYSPAESAMAMVRGSGLVYPREFVRQRFGASAWDDLLHTFDRVEKQEIASAIVTGWYDVRLLAALERAIGAAFGGADTRVLEDLGRFEADCDLARSMRWFFRIVSPEHAVRNIDLYWRRFHDTGHWTTQVSWGEIAACLSDWGVVEAASCVTLTGYLGRVLEILGNPGTVEHKACRARGAAVCEFVWRWRGAAAQPPDALEIRDVSRIGRELAELRDRGALAGAITDLLVTRFGFARATLWEGLPGDGAPLSRTGASSVRDRRALRVLLEARGRRQGWLELETANGQVPGEAFEELLPWLGVALAGTVTPADTAQARAARIEAACLRWSLTPRQGEVLARIARGLANKEIAADLCVSQGTVEIHVTQILKKARADNRASLIAQLWD